MRRIYRLTERTIDKRGQQMLLPEYALEGWSTTLPETFGVLAPTKTEPLAQIWIGADNLGFSSALATELTHHLQSSAGALNEQSSP